jgi:hypothetical protein
MRTISWLAAGAAALALGCASGSASSSTEAPHPAVADKGTQVVGTIQSYTSSSSGQMNGFVLASGQRVRIPESMASQVSDKFPPNTAVQVTGHMVTDPDGRPVLEAEKLTAPSSKATLDLTAAAPPGAPPPSSIGGSGTGGTAPDPTSNPTTPASPGQQPPPVR